MNNKGKTHNMKKMLWVAPLLSLSLLPVANVARNAQQLERAFVLSVTAVIIVMIFLIGIRRYINTMTKEEVDGDK